MGHEYRVRIPRRPHVLLTAAITLAAALTWPAAPFAHKKPKPAPPPPPSLDVLGRVEVGRHPRGVDVWAGHSRAVVANHHGESISIVSLTNPAAPPVEVPVGHKPADVAIDSTTGIAAVTLEGERAVAFVALAGPTLIGRVEVGRHPRGVAMDPALGLAVVANQNSKTISIIDVPVQLVSLELRTGRHPIDVAINPFTHIAAVADREDGTVTLVNLATGNGPEIVRVISLPRHARPNAIAFDYTPDRSVNRLLVADGGLNGVHVVALDAASVPTRTSTLLLGREPTAIAANPGADFALVTRDTDDLVGFTPSTLAVSSVTDVGKHPRGVAIDPASCRAAVSGRHERQLAILEVPCAPGLRITSIEPSSVELLQSPPSLRVFGSGFASLADPKVQILDPTPPSSPLLLTPSSIGNTEIVAGFPPLGAGLYVISVVAGAQSSNALPLTVLPPPQPRLLSGTATLLADGSRRLVLNGRLLDTHARIILEETGEEIPRATVAGCSAPTCVAGLVRATLGGDTYNWRVVNPNATLTNTLAVAVPNPAPQLTAVTPSSGIQQNAFRVVTLTGAGFNESSTVLVAGAGNLAFVDTLVTSQQMTVAISPDVMNVPGTYWLRVSNPSPGGGLSQQVSFTVTAEPTVATTKALVVPDGQPGPVAVFDNGLDKIGLVAVPNAGVLRRVVMTSVAVAALLTDVTRIQNVACASGSGDPVTASPGSIKDIDVNNSSRTVVSLFNENAVAFIDYQLGTIAVACGVLSPYGVAWDAQNVAVVVRQTSPPSLAFRDFGGAEVRQPVKLTGLGNATRLALDVGLRRAAILGVDTGGAAAVLVVGVDTGTVLATVAIGTGARAITIDPNTHFIVVAFEQGSDVTVIEPMDFAVTTGAVGANANTAAADPNSGLMLVTSDAGVTVFSAAQTTSRVDLPASTGSGRIESAWLTDFATGAGRALVSRDQTANPNSSDIVVIGIPAALLPP